MKSCLLVALHRGHLLSTQTKRSRRRRYFSAKCDASIVFLVHTRAALLCCAVVRMALRHGMVSLGGFRSIGQAITRIGGLRMHLSRFTADFSTHMSSSESNPANTQVCEAARLV